MQELKSEEDIERFVNSQPENVLTVVNVSSNDTPCIRVFAAVLALAKNFSGYAAFARLMYDSTPQSKGLAKQLKVLQVGHCLCCVGARVAPLLRFASCGLSFWSRLTKWIQPIAYRNICLETGDHY